MSFLVLQSSWGGGGGGERAGCFAFIVLRMSCYCKCSVDLPHGAVGQVVGIPMVTNCAPLVADLFLFCYARDFMMSLSDDKQADVIDAFNTTSRYFDDILNINNVYFDNMVSQIYPSELQLNKANTSDTEAAF